MLTANAATITYTVKSGDTLSAIAKKYKISLTSLISANKITNSSKLKVGKVLTIPSSTKTSKKSSVKHTTSVTKPAVTKKPTTYKVAKGDSLSKIAKQFGLTVAQLKSYNGLKSDSIRNGQVLKLTAPPAKKPASKPSEPAKPVQTKSDTYTVTAGDTLFSIAKANGLTADNIKVYNHLTSDKIYVGQVLRLTASKHSVEQPSSQVKAVDNITKNSLTAQEKINFINQVAPEAMLAWKQYKILPSLTIAQAILESYFGFSWLSVNGNNYFGIKADSSWKGKYVVMPTKEYDHKGVVFVANEKFRKYSSLHESTVDHTKFLLRPRYANLIGVTDYRVATVNIQQDGYATDPHYANLLQSTITTYNLTQYDVQAGAIASSK